MGILWGSRLDQETADLAATYVASLEAPVARATIKQATINQPSYPSLLAIANGLESVGIEVTSFSLRPEALPKLPLPAVVHLRSGGCAILEELDGEHLILWSADKGRQKTSLEDFGSEFSGAVLVATSTENAVDPYFEQRSQEERRAKWVRAALTLWVLFAFLLTAFVGHTSVGPVFSGLLVTKAIGAFFAIQLLVMDFSQGQYQPAFCKLGGKTNCASVLQSGAASIFGVKMSEIGTIYFIAGILSLAMAATGTATNARAIIATWSLIATLALPYVLFSLGYQAFKMKVFCPLCVAVQLVLIAEAALLFPQLRNVLPPSLGLWANFAVALLVPCIGWVLIKGPVKESSIVPELQRHINRFTGDDVVVNVVMEAAEEWALTPGPLHLSLGPKDAPHRVAIVSSMTCGACSVLHRNLERHHGECGEHVRFDVYLTAGTAEELTPRLYDTLAAAQSRDQLMTAVNDWYHSVQDAKGAKRWAAKYGDASVSGEPLGQSVKMWSQAMPLPYTPFCTIDGKAMPQSLRLRHALKNVLSGVNSGTVD